VAEPPPSPRPRPDEAARPRRRRFRALLAVVAVGLVCALGGLGSLGAFDYVRYLSERNTAQRALDGYLDEVRTAQFEAAYDRLCPEARARESLAEFGLRLTTGPKLVNYHLGGVVLLTVEGDGGSAVYQVRADENYDDGQTVTRAYRVFVFPDGPNPVCPPG
jgi:hypothetical protein